MFYSKYSIVSYAFMHTPFKMLTSDNPQPAFKHERKINILNLLNNSSSEPAKRKFWAVDFLNGIRFVRYDTGLKIMDSILSQSKKSTYE